LPAISPRQIGKVGSSPRIVCGMIVLIETNAFDAKSKIAVHGDVAT